MSAMGRERTTFNDSYRPLAGMSACGKRTPQAAFRRLVGLVFGAGCLARPIDTVRYLYQIEVACGKSLQLNLGGHHVPTISD